MYTKEAIRYSLGLADMAMAGVLEEMADAPLTYPTGNGGCHPLWVIGHLAYVEGMTHEMLGAGSNPVAEWGVLFGQDTVASADAAQYPAFAVVRGQFADLRARTLEVLEAMSEAELDKATLFQPPGLESHFDTVGKALLTVALHQMAHRGHISDALRSSRVAVAVAA